MTLTALFKKGRATTSELREMTGGKGRSIRHRMDTHLIPNNLVREVGRKEHPGNDVRVYELTNDGQHMVADQWDDLAHYTQRETVLDAARQTNDRINDLHNRFDDYDELLGGLRDDLNDETSELDNEFTELKQTVKGDMEQFRSELRDLDDRVDELELEQESLKQKVDELDKTVSNHSGRLDRVEEIAGEAWAWVVGDWVRDRRENGMHPSNIADKLKVMLNGLKPYDQRDWRQWQHREDALFNDD